MNSERGSALLEAVPVIGLLLAFVSALLLTAYFLFTRAYLHYEGEQTLYCLAEAKPEAMCRRQLRARIERMVPFGKFETLILTSGIEAWSLEFTWSINQFQLHFRKRLSLRDIVRNRALHW